MAIHCGGTGRSGSITTSLALRFGARIAGGVVSGVNSDGISGLNLYLKLIGVEVARMQQESDELPDNEKLGGFGSSLRPRRIALVGNHDQLGLQVVVSAHICTACATMGVFQDNYRLPALQL